MTTFHITVFRTPMSYTIYTGMSTFAKGVVVEIRVFFL